MIGMSVNGKYCNAMISTKCCDIDQYAYKSGDGNTVIKIENAKKVIEIYRVPPKLGNPIIAIIKEITDKGSRISYICDMRKRR